MERKKRQAKRVCVAFALVTFWMLLIGYFFDDISPHEFLRTYGSIAVFMTFCGVLAVAVIFERIDKILALSFLLIGLAVLYYLAFSIGFWDSIENPNPSKRKLNAGDEFVQSNLMQSTLYKGLYVVRLIQKTPGPFLAIVFISAFLSTGIYSYGYASHKTEHLEWQRAVGSIIIMTLVISIVTFLPVDAWPMLGIIGLLAFQQYKK